ncbi:MAG: phospho-N-acetylmuramoyl-pentapeptide-transferase, partial [Treponema sp.]|nr:phospho-N-acetylmuramoyl-pentapeptide-transferase [Treponema sp.]
TLAILTYISGRTDYSSYLGIPYITGAGELTVFCLAAVGACIGFLWFNAHPAEVFMGDVGSLSLGGVVAVISLIIKKEILILIIGGVFVIEIASVIIQVLSYKLRKKRVFKMAPIHHHFELSGWAETKVVIRFWILGGLFAIIALSTLKIQ